MYKKTSNTVNKLTNTQKRERNCRNKSHELDDMKKYQLVLTYTKKVFASTSGTHQHYRD